MKSVVAKGLVVVMLALASLALRGAVGAEAGKTVVSAREQTFYRIGAIDSQVAALESQIRQLEAEKSRLVQGLVESGVGSPEQRPTSAPEGTTKPTTQPTSRPVSQAK